MRMRFTLKPLPNSMPSDSTNHHHIWLILITTDVIGMPTNSGHDVIFASALAIVD
jgi:hypothetical protein